MITSSKISSAPTRSHSARRPSRNPGCGATTPMLAATGSTMTAATDSSSSGTWLYGTTSVSATAPAGTPAVPGIPSVATPLPPAASRASVAPWKLPWNDTMRSRPVNPRASLHGSARRLRPRVHQPRLLAAGDPCRDLLGQLHLPWRRRAVRRAVGDGRPDRRGDRRVGVPEDHRAVALHQVDVATTLDVEHVRPLGPGDDERLATDGLEGADRRVDAARDRSRRPGEQGVVGRNPTSGADDRVAPGSRTGAGSQYGMLVTARTTDRGPRRTTSRSR